MAKVVRLKSQEQREWNHNESLLVNDVGVVIRKVSPREQMTMFQVARHVAQTKQGLKTKTPEEPSTVEARVERLPGGNSLAVKFFIDNLGVVGGREAMKQRMLAIHGECQLRTLNGKFLVAVRDPRAERPTAQDAQRTTPTPDNCMCKPWPLSSGVMHPGKHHPVCQYNSKAPPGEQGTFANETTVLPQPSIGLGYSLPNMPAPSPLQSVAIPVEAVPAPEACHCKGWALADGTVNPEGVHHPFCEFKEKWDAANRAVYVIVDLDTATVMRAATNEEVLEAEAAEKTGGSMVISIGGKTYGLILESEVNATETVGEEDLVPGMSA